MELNLSSTLMLNTGVRMPRFGLGTARMKDNRISANAVRSAIQLGYRLIDTSKNYENEVGVGQGIRESGVPENQLFVTTKLEEEGHGYEEAKREFQGSLERLGVRKIDLYLIHSPENDANGRIEAWRALSELVDGQRLRAIGVSNYEIAHLEEIERAGLPVPTVNQIELSPETYRRQRELVDYCQRHTIALMAYSPLDVGRLLENQLITRIARRYNKTPAQVILRWCLQHDFIVIPKSQVEAHLREDADVFDFILADRDMEEIDTI